MHDKAEYRYIYCSYAQLFCHPSPRPHQVLIDKVLDFYTNFRKEDQPAEYSLEDLRPDLPVGSIKNLAGVVKVVFLRCVY